MSRFEQRGSTVDAVLDGFEVVGKIETESQSQSDVRFGDEASILRVLGGVKRLARKLASELRRRHAAGGVINLFVKFGALYRGLKHSRAGFEDTVFFFGAQAIGGGGFGSGAIELAIVEIQIAKGDVNVAVAAMIIVARINFLSFGEVFGRLFAQTGTLLAGRQFVGRPGRVFFSGLLFELLS